MHHLIVEFATEEKRKKKRRNESFGTCCFLLFNYFLFLEKRLGKFVGKRLVFFLFRLRQPRSIGQNGLLSGFWGQKQKLTHSELWRAFVAKFGNKRIVCDSALVLLLKASVRARAREELGLFRHSPVVHKFVFLCFFFFAKKGTASLVSTAGRSRLEVYRQIIFVV